MKLLQSLMNEHVTHSPQLVDLTLQEIVRNGKVTNNYQLFVLGKMARFFKDGLKSADLELENPVNFESGETDSKLKAQLQQLSDSECVHLAAYLLDCIKAGECALHGKGMSATEWINYVLQRQE